MKGESEVIARAREKQRELIELYEKTKIRTDFGVAVPTSDSEVKSRLRRLGQPVCVFGEDSFLRRERLKLLVSKTYEAPTSSSGHVSRSDEKIAESPKELAETFFTPGSVNLLEARRSIAVDSLEIARSRLSFHFAPNNISSEYWNSSNVVASSQVGDSRPLTGIALCPFDNLVAVSGWSGDVNVFDSFSLTQKASLRGHDDRCVSLAWQNSASNRIALASCGVDKTVRLWAPVYEGAVEDGGVPVVAPAQTLEGHEMRVNRVAFHPHLNQFVASTSDDETWRLWDIERREELLLQEGHIAPVFGLSFHPDGSLIATSDIAAVIRVWDLRTGKSVMHFENHHVEQVVGLDISPNGYSMASCSGDNTVRIFDLRQKTNVEILIAHEKLVSCVKFGSDSLMTAGYDCVARVWRTSDYKIVKNLPIHETRIMGADFSADGKTVATACYDRTFKLWTRRDAFKMEIDF